MDFHYARQTNPDACSSSSEQIDPHYKELEHNLIREVCAVDMLMVSYSINHFYFLAFKSGSISSSTNCRF
jgi:hypothetical protein